MYINALNNCYIEIYDYVKSLNQTFKVIWNTSDRRPGILCTIQKLRPMLDNSLKLGQVLTEALIILDI